MPYEQLPDGRIVKVSATPRARPAQSCAGCDEPKPQMRGAGDVVARVTSAFGIQPCDACEQRRQLLNSMFPFGRR